MGKTTTHLKLKIFAAALLIIILTYASLTFSNVSKNNSTNHQELTSFCLGNDEWENS